MTNFKYVEQLLTDYNKREDIYKQYDLEIEEIRINAYDGGGIGAIDYSRDRVQTSSRQGSIVEDLVLRGDNEIRELVRQKKLKKIHFEKLTLAINGFNEIELNIFKYYYQKRYTWNAVSRMIGLNRTSLIDYRNKMVNRIIEEFNIKVNK